MNDDLEIISVSSILNKYNYLVPIYQRNFAWTEVQIVQLIEDIESAIKDDTDHYFLGNLIVNRTDNNMYEVIDGQQRLTTLYLLKKYLGMIFLKESLKFEARKKSNRTLRHLHDSNSLELNNDLAAPEILNGYSIIENFFKVKNIDKNMFIKKMESVYLIQIQVPQNIDLNHYFEIMNTRGEQLELHEIAKAKILEKLENDSERATAAMIWEKCSDMNAYVQMSFDTSMRKELFTDNWTNLNKSITNFDAIKDKVSSKADFEDKKKLKDILEKNDLESTKEYQPDIENQRFESAVSFPHFLLQVNAVIEKSGEEDSSLDDKHFLNNLSWTWSSVENAKEFLHHLLKCRVLFDKYILKREFARDYKETGKWSLQCLEKYRDSKKGSNNPQYVSTLNEANKDNQKLRTLEACLRVTYTSPKTMHWITLVLSELLANEEVNIITKLEHYCKIKVANSNYQKKQGFGIERIVFTYLDYLLYRDGYTYQEKKILSPLQDDWQFQFRNSIEHFHPQNPVEVAHWEEDDLNSFGNLALITVSGNSKFSNLPPDGKIHSYPSIMNQSWKLKIMEEMTTMNNGIWTENKSQEHEKEMFSILEKEKIYRAINYQSQF